MLVYTAGVQRTSLSIAGRVLADLWVSVDALDADWAVKLVDVAADGVAGGIAEGILRSSARDPQKYPALVEPGRRYRVTVDLGHTAATIFLVTRCVLKWLAAHFRCSIATSIPGKAPQEHTNGSVARPSITARARLRVGVACFAKKVEGGIQPRPP